MRTQSMKWATFLLSLALVLPAAVRAAPPPRPILGSPLLLGENVDLWSGRISETAQDRALGLNWEKHVSGVLLAWGLGFSSLREETPEVARLAAKGESAFGVDHWVQTSFGLGFSIDLYDSRPFALGLLTRGTFDLSSRSGGEAEEATPLRVGVDLGVGARLRLPWAFTGVLTLGTERDFTGEIMEVQAPKFAFRSALLIFRPLGEPTPGAFGEAIIAGATRMISGAATGYEEAEEDDTWTAHARKGDDRAIIALGLTLDKRPNDRNGDTLIGLTIGFVYP